MVYSMHLPLGYLDTLKSPSLATWILTGIVTLAA